MKKYLVALAALVVVIAGVTLSARQADAIADLRTQLSARYDILALQNGVGLVPKDKTAVVRLVEVRDGEVIVDGQPLTGRELRDKLGADTDLILRVTYMPLAEQRQMAGGSANAATPAAPVTEPERRERRNEDIVRMGGTVTVDENDVVNGDIALFGGSADIKGEVDGDVNVIGGSVHLGPKSLVTGDLNVVGATLTRDAGARVNGDVNDVGRRFGPFSGRRVPGAIGAMVGNTIAGRVGSLTATLVRVSLLALLALAAMAFGRNSVGRIADYVATDPVRGGLVGFLAELLFVPVLVMTILILVISIIGIPLLLLLPFALVLMIGVMIIGFSGVAYQVGRWLNGRFGWERGPYGTVLLGVLSIVLLIVLARSAALIGGQFITFPLFAAGLLIEYVAWTLGLGAAIQVWLRRRRVISAPPPPAAS